MCNTICDIKCAFCAICVQCCAMLFCAICETVGNTLFFIGTNNQIVLFLYKKTNVRKNYQLV